MLNEQFANEACLKPDMEENKESSTMNYSDNKTKAKYSFVSFKQLSVMFRFQFDVDCKSPSKNITP